MNSPKTFGRASRFSARLGFPRRARLALAVAILASGFACQGGESVEKKGASSGGEQAVKGDIVASWNGGALSTADLDSQLERLPPRMRAQIATPERKRQFVEQQALNEILLAEGKKRGYETDPAIQEQVEALQKRLVIQKVMKEIQEAPTVSEEEVRAHYEQNKDLYSTTQVRASHILVSTEAKAREILEEVRKDPERFAELAKQHSTDPATKDRGGDLGFFGQGRMVPAFESAAFALKQVGDISDVVQTPFGYHIIKLTGRREGKIRPFEEVKDRIRVQLLSQRRRGHMDEELEKLKRAANLRIDEEALSAWKIAGATEEGASGE